ncbi:hypothetical protein FISHEDRAFT_75576 [Fistulina hepatica ATCC 64428]|uniref:Uncharacterized protein n=1 Tax=Fistulina hepatica ATCC 64428 TaxID=1128425 RepID=A0A0D7A7Y4_9AGAR|nr:hypothetical protein FISHEDRAFT_75576 [Fistulina hepatica ATCC 64428]
MITLSSTSVELTDSATGCRPPAPPLSGYFQCSPSACLSISGAAASASVALSNGQPHGAPSGENKGSSKPEPLSHMLRHNDRSVHNYMLCARALLTVSTSSSAIVFNSRTVPSKSRASMCHPDTLRAGGFVLSLSSLDRSAIAHIPLLVSGHAGDPLTASRPVVLHDGVHEHAHVPESQRSHWMSFSQRCLGRA